MLNISVLATNFDLKKMNGRMKIKSTVINGVEIQIVVGGPKISLSTCFTRDSIHCYRNPYCSYWSHLSGLELEDGNADTVDGYGPSDTVHGDNALRTGCRGGGVLDANDQRYSDMSGVSGKYATEDVRFIDMISIESNMNPSR